VVRINVHLSIPIHIPPQAAECGWSEATRIYRRICVARAKGSQIEADEIEATILAPALDSLRNESTDPGDWEARLRQLREGEEARVAEAVTLAELLAPMLAKSLQNPGRSAARIPANPVQTPISPVRPAAPRAAPRGIADFIDEMISQNSSP
jgi:hypothetical protein